MADKRTLDRIKKLLALAGGKNTNPEEAASAHRRAHKLMAEHGLSFEDIYTDGQQYHQSQPEWTDEKVKEAMRGAARRAREEAEREAQQREQDRPKPKESAKQQYARQKAEAESQRPPRQEAPRQPQQPKVRKPMDAGWWVLIGGVAAICLIGTLAHNHVFEETHTPPMVTLPPSAPDPKPAPVVVPPPLKLPNLDNQIQEIVTVKEFSERTKRSRWAVRMDSLVLNANNSYNYSYIILRMIDASTIERVYTDGQAPVRIKVIKSLGNGHYLFEQGWTMTFAPKGTLIEGQDNDGITWKMESSLERMEKKIVEPSLGVDKLTQSTPSVSSVQPTTYYGRWWEQTNTYYYTASVTQREVGEGNDSIDITNAQDGHIAHSVGKGVFQPLYSGSGVETFQYKMDSGEFVMLAYHRDGTVSLTIKGTEYTYKG